VTFWDFPNQEVVRADGSGPGIEVETPTLVSIAPATAVVGGAPLTMTCTGTKFDSWTVIVFNGGDEPTTFIDATHVSTVVHPATASGAGTVPVTVRNGNESSAPRDFTFTVAGVQAEGGYDPGAYTVDEVKAYVAEHPDELDATYSAEQSGKARTTLLDWLAAQEPA